MVSPYYYYYLLNFKKVQYFGAIAIHYKITHCWIELPPDKVKMTTANVFKCEFRLMTYAKKYSNLYSASRMAQKWYLQGHVQLWQHWSSIE